MEPLSLSYATYALIALLNLAVGGSLFGWIYEGHQANCWKDAAQFAQRQIEVHEQGPLRECQ